MVFFKKSVLILLMEKYYINLIQNININSKEQRRISRNLLKIKFQKVSSIFFVLRVNLFYTFHQQMPDIYCRSDGSCPFQYVCDISKNTCSHYPVFPLTTYPIIIYCLFPFASALCNLSGNSFGEYKVLLIMDLLNYSESAATALAYPLITGTALFNFFVLIFKRHPNKNTSLVDYNIIMVLIPNILYGSTLGALVNKFIPPIVADCLIIPLLTLFSIKFFMRFWNYRKQAQLQAQLSLQTQNTEKTEAKPVQQSKQEQQAKFEQRDNASQVDPNQRKDIQDEQLGIQNSQRESLMQNLVQLRIYSEIVENSRFQDQKRKSQQTQKSKKQINPNLHEEQLQSHLKYQATNHWQHILATIIIFCVFQTCSFLAQGKIIFFTMCTSYYIIGICLLTVLFFAFDFAMFRYTCKRMQFYRRINYEYDANLDQVKSYLLICLGGFFGGFNGGVFGIGSSTTMIFTLLYLQIEPSVVSATVGFQVVFVGLASLAQAFATQQIQGNVALLFFLITFVLGGICTFIARYLTRNLNTNKVNQVLMVIVGCLTGTSSIALIANIILSYNNFGATYMIALPNFCP